MNLKDLDPQYNVENFGGQVCPLETAVDALTLEEAIAQFDKGIELSNRLERAAVALTNIESGYSSEDAETHIEAYASTIAYIAEEIGYADMELSVEADATKEEKKTSLGEKTKEMASAAGKGVKDAAKWLWEQLVKIGKAVKEWAGKAGTAIIAGFNKIKGFKFTKTASQKAAKIAPVLFAKGNPSMKDMTNMLVQHGAKNGIDAMIEKGVTLNIVVTGTPLNAFGSTINLLGTDKKITKMTVKAKDAAKAELPELNKAFISAVTKTVKGVSDNLGKAPGIIAKFKATPEDKADMEIAKIVINDMKLCLKFLGFLASVADTAEAVKAKDAAKK